MKWKIQEEFKQHPKGSFCNELDKMLKWISGLGNKLDKIDPLRQRRHQFQKSLRT